MDPENPNEPSAAAEAANQLVNAVPILGAVNAAIGFLRAAIPVLGQLRLAGAVTVEQQMVVRKNYESLVAHADGQFKGPEWELEPPADSGQP